MSGRRQAGIGNSPPAGSLTTTSANDLLVGFQGAGLWDSNTVTATPPSGWAEARDVMSQGLWRQASAATAGQATAGLRVRKRSHCRRTRRGRWSSSR